MTAATLGYQTFYIGKLKMQAHFLSMHSSENQIFRGSIKFFLTVILELSTHSSHHLLSSRMNIESSFCIIVLLDLEASGSSLWYLLVCCPSHSFTSSHKYVLTLCQAMGDTERKAQFPPT